MMNVNTHEVLSEVITVVRVDVPYFRKMCYTNDIDKLDEKTKFLSLFGADSMEEVNKLCKGNEILEDIAKDIEKYNKDLDIIGAYDREQRIIEEARISQRYEDKAEMEKAIEETTKKVTKEVTKQVAEERNIDIAKNMLKETDNIDFISRVTGLDIDTIKGLQ